MSAHSLSLLDTTSSLVDSLKSLSNALFQVPVIITALVLTFVLAILAWIISYIFLRPKEICSMVCAIHYILTVGTIVLGLLSAVGLIDHYFPGSLITGAGVALIVLALPILILVESFNYVVLSNKHARRHRELRTARDRQVRRFVVFISMLGLGAILLVVGLILNAAGIATEAIPQIIFLLLVLWILALGGELIILALARRRRRQMAAVGTGAALNRDEVAAIWVRGFSSYRIGRGETVFTSETMSIEERENAWGVFTERVFVTEELILEEEGQLNLIEVEEAESVTTYAAAGAGAGSGALALHHAHRNQRHPAHNHFFRRWGSVILLLIVALVAVAFTVAVGTVATATLVGIALAFLAPVVFLVIHRIRRDREVQFATETAQKVSTSPAGAAAVVAAPPAAAPRPKQTTGSQPAAALHPARPVPVNPPIAEPQIPPREEPEAPTLPSVESAAPAGAAHVNPDIADETIVIPGRGKAASASPDAAEDALLIAPDAETTITDVPAPKPKVSRGIRITEFQHYLHGVDYPVTRAELLDVARKNNAPPNMIARLEELDEEQQFKGAREVMVGYANHHFLRSVSYPATRDQLLEAARSRNASTRLVTWLQGQKENVTFANLSEVTQNYATHPLKGEEDEEETDEKA